MNSKVTNDEFKAKKTVYDIFNNEFAIKCMVLLMYRISDFNICIFEIFNKLNTYIHEAALVPLIDLAQRGGSFAHSTILSGVIGACCKCWLSKLVGDFSISHLLV